MAPKGKAKAKASAAMVEARAALDDTREQLDGKRRRISKKAAVELAPVSMPKEQVSAMLGYLKYHADPLKEKDMEVLTTCQKALATYAKAGKDGKPQFLSKFLKNKKDLGWVNSFDEEITHVQESHEETEEGWFFGSYILKHMGFEPASLDDDQYDRYLKKVILDSEEHFEYKVEVKEDVEDKMLNKYNFKFIGVTKHRTGTSESSKLSASIDVTKAIKDSAPKVNIKVENQAYINMTVQAKILKSGKGALEKKLSIMTDKMTCLQKFMANLGESKVTRIEKGQKESWEQAIKNVTDEIESVRDVLYDAGLLDGSASEEVCNDMHLMIEAKIKETAVHDAAAKVILKDMKAFTQI